MSQYQSFFISASGNSSQCDEINHFLRSHVVIRTVENIINSGSNCGIQILVEYKDVQQMFSSLEKKPGAKKLTGVQALQQMNSVNFLTNLKSFGLNFQKKSTLWERTWSARTNILLQLFRTLT